MPRVHRFWFLVVAAVWFGCSTGAVSLDDYPARTAKAMCGKIYECCSAEEAKVNSQFAPDLATCQTNTTAALNGKQHLIKVAQDEGRVAYHGDRMGECLERLAAASCQSQKSNATSVIPPCDAYLEPKVTTGGACGMDEECISGRCLGITADTKGMCRAFVAEGESCADAPCGQGLYCEGSSKKCRRMKEDGAACAVNSECATGGCNGRDPDAGTAGTCGLKGGPTSTCFVTNGCSATGAGLGSPLVLLAVSLAARAGGRRRSRASAPPIGR